MMSKLLVTRNDTRGGGTITLRYVNATASARSAQWLGAPQTRGSLWPSVSWCPIRETELLG